MGAKETAGILDPGATLICAFYQITEEADHTGLQEEQREMDVQPLTLDFLEGETVGCICTDVCLCLPWLLQLGNHRET